MGDEGLQRSITDDESLASRIQGGEAAAESELVERFSRRVYAMGLARTRDPEAARELAQDVMMAVIGCLRVGGVRDTSRLGAFVCGTARNLINNYLRVRSRKPREEPFSEDLRLESSAVDLLEVERSQLVRRALASIPPRDQQILLMTFVDGCRPAEIAARLRMTSDAVRQRKRRALLRVTEMVRRASQE